MTRTILVPLAAVLIGTGVARAEDPLCSSLPNPVYGLGGSAQKQLLAQVGTALSKSNEKLTLIYQAPGACFGIFGLRDDTRITGTASWWDDTGAERGCTLPELGQAIDYAVMGNLPTSCEGISEDLPGIATFPVAIGSWNVIVPNASTQQSISSEALYFVYGFGELGQAEPWTNEALLFSRGPTSAAAIFIAKAAGLPVQKMRGIDVKTNQAMITNLASASDPEAAIGFVSGEVADANRETVRTLAYQDRGQSCAYWPDSTPTAFDKRNVRNGQYAFWSPSNFYARVDDEGVITHEGARTLIGYLTGRVPTPPELDVDQVVVDIGNIPVCAMNVWRDSDLGPLYSHVPDEPCGCWYEQNATGTTSCTACDDNDDCSTDAPVCRRGFCEVK